MKKGLKLLRGEVVGVNLSMMGLTSRTAVDRRAPLALWCFGALYSNHIASSLHLTGKLTYIHCAQVGARTLTLRGTCDGFENYGFGLKQLWV